MIRAALAACLALALAACASVPDVAGLAPPEAKSYTVSANAMADVDAALTRAASSGKRVMLVFGANWCHDSTALAGWLETARFAALTAVRYEVVFVNVGMPQTGDGHNLDVARRFGLSEIPGTPALLVLTADGRPVNLDTAASWRNAASRSEDAIFAELAALATPTLADATATPAATTIHVAGDDAGCRFAPSPNGPWHIRIADVPGIDKGARIEIRTVSQAPWRCVASGIYELQKTGASVGFVSNPENGLSQQRVP